MFWKALSLVVNLTFLLLAITIMAILIKNENYRADILDYKVAFEKYQEQNRNVMDNNIAYMESRVNRAEENQDSYQSTTESRLNVLEQKMDKLQKDNKINSRIVNNNTATAIVNGKEQKREQQ